MIKLEVTEGASPGQTFSVTDSEATLGRSPECEVTLEDGHVSARHARIVQGLHAATVEDLGSTNGSWLLRDDETIDLGDLGDAMELRDGDVLQLGSDDEICKLAVSLVDEDKGAHLVSVKQVDDEVGATAFADDPLTLRALYDIQSKIGRAADLDGALEAIADAIFELVPHATHVTVVLQESHPKQDAKKRAAARHYAPVLTRTRPEEQGGPKSDSKQFVPVPRSIYRKVLAERAAVLAADAPKDVGASPSVMAASVRSAIAVPLWQRDQILGVLQVDNRDAPGMLKGGDLDVVLVVAEQASLAVANRRLIQQLEHAEKRLRDENTFLKDRERRVEIIGDSLVMKELMTQVDKVADTNVTVLIEGETGTGKELIASSLHHRSRRRDALFVAQNCAALAESLLESELFGHTKGAFTGATDDKKGLFDLADGSTLFLDEITEAPMSIQSKLLRALQEGEIRPVGAPTPRRVNVRVVTATNRNLEAEVKAGRFREDLYYRLKVFPLRVPPLRERRSDVALLVEHFLERYAAEIGKPVAGVSPEAMNLLMAYDWPGNVRELQNEVQRVVIQVDPGAYVTPELLSPGMRQGEEAAARAGATKGTLKEKMQAVEKFLIYEALREHDNNKTSTAKSLGITREGLHKKLRQFDS